MSTPLISNLIRSFEHLSSKQSPSSLKSKNANIHISAYNDIVPTNYQHLLPLFNHPAPESSFHRAATKAELTEILAKPQLQDPPHLQLVELVLDKLDTAWKLGTVLAWRSAEHKDYLTNEGFVDTYGGWGLEGEAGGDVKWS